MCCALRKAAWDAPSGADKLTAVFSWLFELGLVQFRACPNSFGTALCSLKFRCLVGKDRVYVVLNTVHWVPGCIIYTPDLLHKGHGLTALAGPGDAALLGSSWLPAHRESVGPTSRGCNFWVLGF